MESEAEDGREFAEALAAHFPAQGFVTFLETLAPGGGERFLAICSRGGHEEAGARAASVAVSRDGDGIAHAAEPALHLTVTNCLSSIYSRRLGAAELAELRGSAGMAEFAWTGFLRLLASALLGEEGCSGAVDVQFAPAGQCANGPSASPLAGEMLPSRGMPLRAQLVLRFRLEFASLVSKVDLIESVPAPVLSPGCQTYIQELRRFTVDAVTAARAAAASGSRRRPPPLNLDDLLPKPSTSAVSPASTASGPTPQSSRGPTPHSGSKRAEMLNQAQPARKPVPKKRPGSGLVNPTTTRRKAGSNPFQLSS